MISTTQNILDFFKLFGQNRIKTKGSNTFINLFTQQTEKEKYYIFRTNTFSVRRLVLTQGEMQSVAHINEKKEISVSVSLNYFKPAAKRKHFRTFLREYAGLLPNDIANYDTSEMKLLLGDLNANMNIVINDSALKQVFANSFLANDFCREYSKFQEIEFEANCLEFPQRVHKVFLRKYEAAKKSYLALK